MIGAIPQAPRPRSGPVAGLSSTVRGRASRNISTRRTSPPSFATWPATYAANVNGQTFLVYGGDCISLMSQPRPQKSIFSS